MAANQTTANTAQANQVAERFGIDRDLIQQTMQRVQSGEMTPAEATRLLLSDQPASPPPQGESLASLTQRLGNPPADIVDRWCAQMRITAVVHHSESNHPLPPIDLRQWSLQSSGQLSWNGRSYLAAADSIDVSLIDAQSQRHIQQFRDSFRDSFPDSFRDSLFAATEPTTVAGLPRADVSPTKHAIAQRQHKSSPARRVVLGGLIGLCFILIAGVLYKASRPNVANKDAVADKDSASIFDSNSKDDVATIIEPSPIGELETFDEPATNPVTDAVEIADRGVTGKDDFLSLDAWMPAAAGFDTKEFSPSADNATVAGNAIEASDPAAIAALDSIGDEDKAAPDESPQKIRASQVMSVQLPATSEVDQAIELWPMAINSCQLDFPLPSPLLLREQGASREIIEEKKQAAIAEITSNSSGTRFHWTPLASQISASVALVQGRLQADSGDVVYLRPTIEADLWPLDLQRPDVRPTWDLTAPIPPRVTRLSIDFQLPDEVEVGWIEPVDPTSPRRATAVAVLTAKKDDSVSLGVRLDIRCSRKLSCRVRYAARIDADTPWQVVSRPMLEQTADNLVAKSELIGKQITQMSALYSQADTDARRVLRPQRDALNRQSESLRKTSEGIAKLQSLVSHVEAAAALQLRVWVDWPDGEQTLLDMQEDEI